MPEPIMAIAALAVITIALIGQAIEMRKIRVRTVISNTNSFRSFIFTGENLGSSVAAAIAASIIP